MQIHPNQYSTIPSAPRRSAVSRAWQDDEKHLKRDVVFEEVPRPISDAAVHYQRLVLAFLEFNEIINEIILVFF